MKSVVFVGSVKNYVAMLQWADFLRQHGASVETPKLGKDTEIWDTLSEAEQRKQKLEFIHDHNERIDRSDILFVFNIDNHVGNSVTLEIGYALAKGMEIYAMKPDAEQGRDVLYAGYCETSEQLLKVLQ